MRMRAAALCDHDVPGSHVAMDHIVAMELGIRLQDRASESNQATRPTAPSPATRRAAASGDTPSCQDIAMNGRPPTRPWRTNGADRSVQQRQRRRLAAQGVAGLGRISSRELQRAPVAVYGPRFIDLRIDRAEDTSFEENPSRRRPASNDGTTRAASGESAGTMIPSRASRLRKPWTCIRSSPGSPPRSTQ